VNAWHPLPLFCLFRTWPTKDMFLAAPPATQPPSTMNVGNEKACVLTPLPRSSQDGAVSSPKLSTVTPSKSIPNVETELYTSMASLAISTPKKAPCSPSKRTPFPPPPTTPSKKYYVVTRGKCTGVFNSWPYVQALIHGMSGNCHKSYPTYEEACRAYQDAKGKGLVEIIRHCGDEERFGSDEMAME